MGETTPGEPYFQGLFNAKLAGNQLADGGLHMSLFNRRDGVSLVTAGGCYAVPNITKLRDMVSLAMSGKPFDCGAGPIGPRVQLDADFSKLKLLQGQLRNAAAVGGHAYSTF